MKKNIILLILALILLFIFYTRFTDQNIKNSKVEDSILCYTLMQKSENGAIDEYNLRLNIKDSKALGTLEFLPYEKDKKIGSIEGEVIKPSIDIVASRANLWWTATSEGFTTKEELKVIFGDGTASIGLGEMVEQNDGSYKYKSIPEIVYGLVLYQVSCI